MFLRHNGILFVVPVQFPNFLKTFVSLNFQVYVESVDGPGGILVVRSFMIDNIGS